MTTPERAEGSGKKARPTATPVRASRYRPYMYGAGAGIVVLVLVWGALALFSGSPSSTVTPRRVGRSVNPVTGIAPNTAVLFFLAPDGAALVEQEIEVPLGETPLSRARLIAQQQLIPPAAPLVSPFPDGTTLRAIYVTPGGDAFVDLSQQVSTGHPGGSLDELFTVYALVNALTMNVPEIAAVQILIEGQEVDTLAGHVDLRRPLRLNMTWVSQAEALDDDVPVEEPAEDL